MEQAKKVFENVSFYQGAYDCARGSHALVMVTAWEQFRALDFKQLASVMECPVIVDLRNIYLPEEAIRNGFQYYGVGRPKSLAYQQVLYDALHGDLVDGGLRRHVPKPR